MTELKLNTYDLDGVISIGITPRPEDIIITGRSFEEAPETYKYLQSRGIYNAVYFQKRPYDEKTRERSGQHKAEVLQGLQNNGVKVGIHFEDDLTQINEIKKNKKLKVEVVHLVHNLTEKENVRHIEE